MISLPSVHKIYMMDHMTGRYECLSAAGNLASVLTILLMGSQMKIQMVWRMELELTSGPTARQRIFMSESV